MWFRFGRMRVGWWALPFIAAYFIGAALGMLVWWIIKLVWFVFAVMPWRIIVMIKNGIHNKRIARAETRMEQYVDDQDD